MCSLAQYWYWSRRHYWFYMWWKCSTMWWKWRATSRWWRQHAQLRCWYLFLVNIVKHSISKKRKQFVVDVYNSLLIKINNWSRELLLKCTEHKGFFITINSFSSSSLCFSINNFFNPCYLALYFLVLLPELLLGSVSSFVFWRAGDPMML